MGFSPQNFLKELGRNAMTPILFKFAVILSASVLLIVNSSVPVWAQSSALRQAKSAAEAKGYVFETNHDEIVAKAKKEGKVRFLSTWDAQVVEQINNAFRKKYPFIGVTVGEHGSVESAQRFLLELKAGRGKEWDAVRLYTEFYDQYISFLKKFDLLGMAEQGVLTIPPKMVDPRTRNSLFLSSEPSVIAYNKTLISEDKVPNSWQDFLKPEFKGRKFITDIRPLALAVLVPGWGMEKVLDFAKKIAAQDPIWVRGHTKPLTAVLAGEYPLFLGPNYASVRRVQAKDRVGVLGYKILEPVPLRIHQANAVLEGAANAYAGLLLLEFAASPEGQKIIDQYWPLAASAFAPGSHQEEMLKGKTLSIVDASHYARLDDYMDKIVQAYGFPKATR
jgi:ABC-type Fe3+ transport system substrate-binding protein